jgi:peptidoglycan/LPS O-acetylase OafA/YrhL
MSAPHSTDTRNPRLDGLRGIAILLVVFHHGGLRLPLSEGPALHLYATAVELGFVGVDLFFVLSGYLITGILLRTKDAPDYYRTFYVRRTLRIFPVYYLWLVFMLLVIPQLEFFAKFGYFQHAARFEPTWYWLYLSNVKAALDGVWQHSLLSLTWSLAIEEQFYLVWPFVVRRLSREGLRRACLACLVLAPALRTGLVLADVNPLASVALTPCRIDTLAAGALLAVMSADPTGRARCLAVARRALPLGALALVVLVGVRQWGVGVRAIESPLVHDPWIQTLGYSLFAGTFAALLASTVLGDPGGRGLLASRGLRVFGRTSYAMYLTHTFVGGMLLLYVFNPLDHPGWGGALLSYAIELAGMLAFAGASWLRLETHVERLKGRWRYARRPEF